MKTGTGKKRGAGAKSRNPSGARKAVGGEVAQELLDAILERSELAVFLCDKEGRILRASRAAYGLCSTPLRGARFEDVLSLVPANGWKSRKRDRDVPGAEEEEGGREHRPFLLGPVLEGGTIRGLEVAFSPGEEAEPTPLVVDAFPIRPEGRPEGGCVVLITRPPGRDSEGAFADRWDLYRTRRESDYAIRDRNRELSVLNEELLHEIRERIRMEEGFRKNSEWFHAIFEQAPVGIVISDRRGTITAANAHLKEMLGFEREEIAGRNIREILHPDSKHSARAGYKRLARSRRGKGKTVDGVIRLLHRDGGEKTTAVCVSVFASPQSGGPETYLGTVLDITEAERSKRILSETSELLETVFSGIHLLIAYMDADFNFVRVNRAYAEADGRAPEFYPGRNHFDLFPDKENEAIFRRVVETGEPFAVQQKPFEYAGNRERGTTYWDWSLLPVRDPGGKVRGLVLSLLDVTERRKAEIRIRQSEERFRSLVEMLPIAIFLVQDGRIVFRNRLHVDLFGKIPSGADLKRVLPVYPEDADHLGRLIAAMESGEELAPPVTFRVLPEGEMEESVRWVLCQGGPVLHLGRPAYLVAATDVTRPKELEQMVLVREKLATLGIIAAGIAHEIRNPLSGMNIYLSALAHLSNHSDRMDPETKERIEVISGQLSRASDKISSVIRGIMDFTRPSSPSLARLDLNGAVGEAIRLCASTIRMQKVEISTSLSPDLPLCHGDRILVGQVLANLITNALQAMEEKDGAKHLRIATAEENGKALVRVSDSGEGVPPHLREQIFDPFFTTRKKGYGIGLSFCRRVVEDHRGAISVHTSEWGGAEFRIAIPVGEEESAP